MNDNLSFKNIFKRETKLATYIIICMTIVVLSLSYAMFFKVDGNSKNQVVEAGDLVFTYENTSQTITSTGKESCFMPMSADETALYLGTCDYKLSVQNTGSLKGAYTLKLVANEDNTIEASKLKVVLRKQEGETFQIVGGYEQGKIVSELSDGILIQDDEMEQNTTTVYSVSLIIDDSLATDSDTNKVLSYKIEGTGLVHESQDLSSPAFQIQDNYTENPKLIINGKVNLAEGLDKSNYQIIVENMKNGVIESSINVEKSEFQINNINFTEAGNYQYKIYFKDVREEEYEAIYDQFSYIVDVIVAETADGKLNAIVQTNEVIELQIKRPSVYVKDNNTVGPTIYISGEVLLEGRAIENGEFNFLANQGEYESGVGTNDENGKFMIPILINTEELSTGKYQFEIYQINSEQDGVVYDETKYTVEIEVVKDESENIKIVNAISKEIIFKNYYKATPVWVEVSSTVTFSEVDFETLEYQMIPINGTEGEVLIANNGNDGIIKFSSITYEKVGTYEYKIVQVPGKNSNVNYDTTEFILTVTINDDNYGKLTASVAYSDDLTFENTVK